jgi:23S rRNA (adenine2503-C2)-methyltransferase
VARSPDSAERLVIRLADGEHIEAVVMPDDSVCVSTQVGCAVGCRFCASGLAGLTRNLSAHEILEQVVHARRRRPELDRVVFMGIGEPTHNLDAVVRAATVLADDGGVPPRRQTLSTVGSSRGLQRLAVGRVRPSLALSLHSADDDQRGELLPRAPREPVTSLVAAAEEYGRVSGRPVQYAWALLAGVNDTEADVDALVALLDGVTGYLNVIPYNPVTGLGFVRPRTDRVLGFVRALRRRGVLATVRWSVGAEAEAACGQLRLGRA